MTTMPAAPANAPQSAGSASPVTCTGQPVRWLSSSPISSAWPVRCTPGRPTPAAVGPTAAMMACSCSVNPVVSSAFIGGPSGWAVTWPASSTTALVPLPPASTPSSRPGSVGGGGAGLATRRLAAGAADALGLGGGEGPLQGHPGPGQILLGQRDEQAVDHGQLRDPAGHGAGPEGGLAGRGEQAEVGCLGDRGPREVRHRDGDGTVTACLAQRVDGVDGGPGVG